MTTIEHESAADDRESPPERQITIGEDSYTARCPKLSVWLDYFGVMRAAVPEIGEFNRTINAFLAAALGSVACQQIRRQLESWDYDLDLPDVVEAINELVQEWEPWVSERVTAMGVRIGNREQRRTATRPPARRSRR